MLVAVPTVNTLPAIVQPVAEVAVAPSEAFVATQDSTPADTRAVPAAPAVPAVPAVPAAPAGILKSKIAAVGVLPAASVTLADCPAGRVSVLPAATVGVTPSVPSLP